jgi:hypothetical protein
MPYTKEQKRECDKKWRENNKEKIREYREKNKEKIIEYMKEYRENNKEKIKEQNKEYHKTEVGIKISRIANWKKYGVISDDWDTLYNKYLTTLNCEDCNIELIEGNYGSNKRCLDHNHETGEVRGIVCNTCNVRRG